MGGSTPLTSVTTNTDGTTAIADSVSTTGSQTYKDAVTLTGNVTLDGANVSLNSTVNGAFDLLVNSGGTTTFGSTVGDAVALAGITTNAGGITRIANNVSTSGDQMYNDAVTLTGDATLTGSNVNLSSTINGAFGLTVNASGTTTFGNTAGNSIPLSRVTTNAEGTTRIAGNVTTTGNQAYNDALTLTGTATLLGANVSFDSTVDGGFGLTVNSPGTTTFGGTVGSSTPLTSLTTSAGGTTEISGNVSTTGGQTYDDAVTLTGTITLTGADVSLNSTVNGPFGLTVNAGRCDDLWQRRGWLHAIGLPDNGCWRYDEHCGGRLNLQQPTV